VANPYVAIGRMAEACIKQAEEPSDRTSSSLFATWPEQQRAERRAQCESVEGLEQDRERDRQCKLAVERARYSRHESGRNKNGGQDERDPDQRAVNLVHRFQRRVLG
jgi:hypothetical protein